MKTPESVNFKINDFLLLCQCKLLSVGIPIYLLNGVHDLSTKLFSCKWILLYFVLPVWLPSLIYNTHFYKFHKLLIEEVQ